MKITKGKNGRVVIDLTGKEIDNLHTILLDWLCTQEDFGTAWKDLSRAANKLVDEINLKK